MSEFLFHGDPCTRCPESRPGKPVMAARMYSMCSMCWLGATERQRRDAIFDDVAQYRESESIAALEALAALPSFEPPEPEQWGEAA